MTFASTIQHWRSNLAASREFAALGTEGRHALARDIGIPVGLLADIASHGARSGGNLGEMMDGLAVDPEVVRRRDPAILQEMQVTCSGCASARRCRRDLDRGWGPSTFDAYCPNSPTLVALRDEAPVESPEA
ncbi:hypothetical protein [Microvirga massiliensis]|uniref:hypothetical protein n=1 Tax=Microvirga massiliensis TaxID=1033741 RepID=UPI00065FFA9F|nr:hypothetical protein [Microvirga massiliensis]